VVLNATILCVDEHVGSEEQAVSLQLKLDLAETCDLSVAQLSRGSQEVDIRAAATRVVTPSELMHADALGHGLDERRILSHEHSAVPFVKQMVHRGNRLELHKSHYNVISSYLNLRLGGGEESVDESCDDRRKGLGVLPDEVDSLLFRSEIIVVIFVN